MERERWATLQASTALSLVGQELLFDRFEVLEELGAGGFGTVMRAVDHVTGHEVALKLLHRVDQNATERFKKEFRALVEVAHPNLVRLGELFERKGVWAFSMELVPGSEFLDWVRTRRGFDEARLRSALVQLAGALAALHAAGLVHCDIKSANVRVTPEGRVVLLDFGVVTHLGPAVQSTTQHIVGTLAYMAPEQTEHGPITAAADMYATGVLLYEALAARPPFSGDMLQVLMAKYGQTPVPPHDLCAEVPPDLEALCLELLAREPDARPSAAAVLARLGGPAKPAPISVPPPPDHPFVGRWHELALLSEHFARARRQGPVLVLIEGESGIGKTALISRFVDTLRSGPLPIQVLRGRCHPFEHVTYKAFDDIIEQVVRTLRARGDAVQLPASSRLLPQLFPALSKAPSIAGRGNAPRAQRTDLFDAFRNLLAFLTIDSPLLVTIDDLQWSDSESLALVKDLLDYGRLPDVLIVASMRPLEAHENVALEALCEHPASSLIPLSTLSSEDARDLIHRLLLGSRSPERVEHILQEARGHPLFLVELAREGNDAPELGGAAAVTLESLIRRRVAELLPPVRQVLELVCVAAAPVPHGIIANALDIPLGTVYRALATLRTEHLVRSVQLGAVVAYHSRSGEAVIGELDPKLRAQMHTKLAEAWLDAEHRVASHVAYHFMAAGERARAAPWLERAADEALETAGFERAAELLELRLSVEEVPVQGEARKEMLLLLADAQASAGRCSASAGTLLKARELADGDERRELLLRAAQQLLQAGEVDAGFRAARTAIEEVGLSWSKGPVTALARLGMNRLRLRKLTRKKPPVHDAIPLQCEQQLDTLSRLLHPLFFADLLRCEEMVAHYARLAWQTGSPSHIARSLGMQSVMGTMRNPSEPRMDLNDRAAEWAALADSPEVLAYHEFTRGGCLDFSAHFGDAAEHFQRAENLYATQCPGQVWMQVNARAALLGCLFMKGSHRLFAHRASEWMRDAHVRGDAFAKAQLTLVGRGASRFLLADDPEQALRDIESAFKPLRAVNTFGLHHLFEIDMIHQVLTYAGPLRAYEWWREERPQQRLLYRRLRGFAPDLLEGDRAEATLCMGLHAGRPDLLAVAGQLAEKLVRAAAPRVRARALLIRAQLLAHAGQRTPARVAALQASDLFRELGEFRAFAGDLLACALSSESDVQACEAKILHWLEAQGWHNPHRALVWMLPIYPLLEAEPKAVPARETMPDARRT